MNQLGTVAEYVDLSFEFGGEVHLRPFDLTLLEDEPLMPLALAGMMYVLGYERMFAIDEMGRAWAEDLDSHVMVGVSPLVMHSMLEYGPPELRAWYVKLTTRNV